MENFTQKYLDLKFDQLLKHLHNLYICICKSIADLKKNINKCNQNNNKAKQNNISISSATRSNYWHNVCRNAQIANCQTLSTAGS